MVGLSIVQLQQQTQMLIVYMTTGKEHLLFCLRMTNMLQFQALKSMMNIL